MTDTHLSQQVGCARFVWNNAWSLSQTKYPGYTTLSKLLPLWKREHPWLAEADSMSLQQSLRNHDQAWRNFFDFPEFFERPTLKRRFFHDSYRYVGKAVTKTRPNAIWIPKLGWRTFRASPPWQGRVTSITITRKAGKW